VLTCVEVGGSSVETVIFADDGTVVRVDGAHRREGSALAIATPGIVEGNRVVAASNLGWFDVDPAAALGLGPGADLVLNDAEAAALGELALRDLTDDIVFVSLGTGVGGAVVLDGLIVAGNLFGHAPGFSDMPCVCGRRGCLETVAGGWALPAPLNDRERDHVARAVATALEREPHATGPLVVVGGGLASRYPDLVLRIAEFAPQRVVEPSAAPHGFKSASAWGLRAMVDRAASAPVR
jgi:predicted NBD/HSP70 family sugar kinase